MKHTPGPWEVSEEWHGDVYIDSEALGEGSIAIAKLINPEPGDAALIAAAPDMLATLEAIRNDCHAWLDGEMDSLSQGDLLQAFANAAQLAIDEATEAKK